MPGIGSADVLLDVWRHAIGNVDMHLMAVAMCMRSCLQAATMFTSLKQLPCSHPCYLPLLKSSHAISAGATTGPLIVSPSIGIWHVCLTVHTAAIRLFAYISCAALTKDPACTYQYFSVSMQSDMCV